MSNNNDKITKGIANSADRFVAERIRKIRVMQGMSQQQIAKALAVSIQQIQKYEAGTNRISSGKLYDLASFLKLPINYFFERHNHYGLNLAFNTNILEKEILVLVNSFSLIEDPKLRKHLLDTINLIARR